MGCFKVCISSEEVLAVLTSVFFPQPVLFFMCMGNELFFCLLYIMYYIEEPQGENQQALALLFPFASFIH